MDAAVDLTGRALKIADFLRQAGWQRAERRLLAADASFRRYDRLTDGGQSAVLMDAPPPQEDVRPFLRIAGYLSGLGYSAPKRLAADPEAGLLLLEDLGDATFTKCLAAGDDEAPLYRLAVDLLIDLHRRPPPDDVAAYDLATFLREAQLLPEWTAPALGLSLGDAALASYRDAWRDVLPLVLAGPTSLTLRDFHVDNLMRLPGRHGIQACGLLDFQDALIGPTLYDLVSLLEDARRDVAASVIATERAHYRQAFADLEQAWFDAAWAVLAAQRHAKVLGIFTRLCRRDGKPSYLRHMPRLWRLLEQALAHPGLLPVREWLDRHWPAERRATPTP